MAGKWGGEKFGDYRDGGQPSGVIFFNRGGHTGRGNPRGNRPRALTTREGSPK